MRPYWVRVDPHPVDWCLYRERNLDTDLWREGHVKMEPEMGEMQLYVTKCQGLLVTTRS